MTRKRKIRSKGSCRGHVIHFWDPPNISQTVELATSNLARRLTAVSSNERKCKIGSILVTWGSRDPILQFWDPPNISPTSEARNLKLGKETDGSEF